MIMRYLKIAVFFAVVAACVALYARMTYLEMENKRLSSELVRANRSILALDEALTKREAIRKKERTLIDAIESEPPEHDGDTAIVLRNAIKRLR